MLDGAPDVEPPEEWIISRICEEFHCLPSQAARELLDHDGTLVMDILALRNYAHAQQYVKDAKSDVKMSPAVQQVFDVQAEIMRQDGPQVT
jgi:hypothetical protein